MKNGKLILQILKQAKVVVFSLFLFSSGLFGFVDGRIAEIGTGFMSDDKRVKLGFSFGLGIEFFSPLGLSASCRYAFERVEDVSAFLRTNYVFSPMMGLKREINTKRTYLVFGVRERYFLNSLFFVFADELMLAPLNRKEDFRFWLGAGLGIKFYANDEDRDGVRNGKDECPRTGKGVKVDSRGCPLDSDGDGVFDGLDRCPATPFAAFVDSLGCPFDSDGDGVFDGVDLCPGTPAGIFVDSAGCPFDSDKDGVPDYADSCNNTPFGAYVDQFGCPKDSDYDGVPDGIDECDFTPTGFEVNAFGCPHYLPVTFEVIYDPIDEFGNLRASIIKKLDMLAVRIRAYPTRIIELGGYTDSEGSIPYNVGRAKLMVNKVKDYLVSKGVSQESLVLAYYGKKNFIADNSTPQGRAKNRRVEFKYLYDKVSERGTKEK